jgi:Undecaprenyl-phosphate glucose phosphotransferase
MLHRVDPLTAETETYAGREAWLAAPAASKIGTFTSMLAVAEIAAIAVAAVVAKLVYIDLVLEQSQPLAPYLALAVPLAPILFLSFKQSNLHSPDTLADPVVGYGKLCGAVGIAFLILLGVLYIFKVAEDYSRGWFLLWFATSTLAVISVRVFAKRTFHRMVAARRLQKRIAIFGTHDFVTAMTTKIEEVSPCDVVTGKYLSQPHIVGNQDWLNNGGMGELKKALARNAHDSIVIGLPASDSAGIQAAIGELASYSTELLLCTELEPCPVVARGTRNFGTLRTHVINIVPPSEHNGVVKNLFDCALAIVGLVALCPLLALVAIAIKLDSPGPVFFRQRRYGRNNRIFRIFKFRTMTVAEDGDHVQQARLHDPRVTRVGRFLRRTSIDELPQLFNVLTGEMSIVGPRPHALAHDQDFESQLDQFSRRRRVRPGLTGWAQVNGYRGETKSADAIRGRMNHDLYYIDNWSIWLDIEIITRTMFVLFRGAY